MEGGADGTAPLAWHDFLERMRQPSASEFVKAIKGSAPVFPNFCAGHTLDSVCAVEIRDGRLVHCFVLARRRGSISAG
jgi:hypothetical protein